MARSTKVTYDDDSSFRETHGLRIWRPVKHWHKVRLDYLLSDKSVVGNIIRNVKGHNEAQDHLFKTVLLQWGIVWKTPSFLWWELHRECKMKKRANIFEGVKSRMTSVKAIIQLDHQMPTLWGLNNGCDTLFFTVLRQTPTCPIVSRQI